jgi:hypothetical protein
MKLQGEDNSKIAAKGCFVPLWRGELRRSCSMKLQGEDKAKLVVWFISHQPCKYIANANYMGNPIDYIVSETIGLKLSL